MQGCFLRSCTGGLMARQAHMAKCPAKYALTLGSHYPKKKISQREIMCNIKYSSMDLLFVHNVTQIM
jgi:hypothetical protein